MSNMSFVDELDGICNVPRPLETFLRSSRATVYKVLTNSTMLCSFKIDTVVVHAETLDDVRMASQSLVDASLDFVIKSLHFPGRGDLKNFSRITGEGIEKTGAAHCEEFCAVWISYLMSGYFFLSHVFQTRSLQLLRKEYTS